VLQYAGQNRTQTSAYSIGTKRLDGAIMKNLIWMLVLACFSFLPSERRFATRMAGPSWAFAVPDRFSQRKGPRAKAHSGSTKSYTPAQIDDLFNPPDWFPEEHGSLPSIIEHGIPGTAQACVPAT